MRFINYICRLPFALFISFIFSVILYIATIFGMLFIDWNREFDSIKTIHNDIGEVFLVIMGLKEDEQQEDMKMVVEFYESL